VDCRDVVDIVMTPGWITFFSALLIADTIAWYQMVKFYRIHRDRAKQLEEKRENQ
jgi:hypothetical protein